MLGAEDFEVPPLVRELLEGVRIVCTPMAAAGRYVGVVLSEREPGLPEMDEDERHLLWTLGKAIAMASVAREVTAYDEQSRQLQQRIDLAREIHEGVVQRLFGVSLALSREELLDADSQRRCAAEVQTALADLRTALKRPLGHTSRPTAVTFAEELEQRPRRCTADLEIVLEGSDRRRCPRSLEALAQSILVEAVRNARKHAHASRASVSLRNDGGTFVLEVRNDGAHLAQRRPGRASACAWPRSRRSSTAGCSSTGSPSRARGRCVSWCRPASERPRRCPRRRSRGAPARTRSRAGGCVSSSSTTTTSCTGASG